MATAPPPFVVYRLVDAERTAIGAAVGDADDAQLVAEVIETRVGQLVSRGELADDAVPDYILDVASNPRLITVHIYARAVPTGRAAGASSTFSDADAAELAALSTRVAGAVVVWRRRKLQIGVVRRSVRDAVALHLVFDALPPTARRLLYARIDFDEARVTHPDDRQRIAAVYEEVINCAPPTGTPQATFWLDPLEVDGDAPRRRVVVGYALCFVNMPNVSSAFMRYLRERFGHRVVARVYVAFDGAHRCAPTFVVNVRAAGARDDAAVAAIVATQRAIAPLTVVPVAEPRGRATNRRPRHNHHTPAVGQKRAHDAVIARRNDGVNDDDDDAVFDGGDDNDEDDDDDDAVDGSTSSLGHADRRLRRRTGT